MRVYARKNWLVTLLLVLVLFAFSACGGNDEAEKSGEEVVTLEAQIYYASHEYLESGDGDHLVLHACQLTAEETPYMAVMEALRSVSEDADQSACETMVGDDLKIRDIYAKDGTIFVDVSSEGLSGGSLEETLFIEQVVETYLHTFEADGIRNVQFFVDGEQAETLMGHWDVSEPFGHIAEEGSEQ